MLLASDARGGGLQVGPPIWFLSLESGFSKADVWNADVEFVFAARKRPLLRGRKRSLGDGLILRADAHASVFTEHSALV